MKMINLVSDTLVAFLFRLKVIFIIYAARATQIIYSLE